MSAYADSSALLKLYVVEAESAAAYELLHSRWPLVTARHTLVEMRRNLTRLLRSRALERARAAFGEDWVTMSVVELDEDVCERAARLAEVTGAKALDALHLGALEAGGGGVELPLITFDRPLAAAARSLGWEVLGA